MPSPKPKYREVDTPSISANQLALYLNASPATRKRIIRDARWQSTAVVSRYQQARKAISACLCDAIRSPSTFAQHRKALVDKLDNQSNTTWVKADLESSIEALDKYAASLNETGLNKLDCKGVTGSVPPLSIGGA